MIDWCATQSLLDIMNIHEGSSVLKFSDDSTFSASELSFIVLHVAMNRMDLALVFSSFCFYFLSVLCVRFS